MYKILVVDDDEGILDALTLILEESGYSVQTTPKREEVYQQINQYKPDVILLDILMSGQDGRLICKKIKQTPVIKDIPIIMISAHPSAKRGAEESGADDFLAKPFEITDLLSKIEKFTIQKSS
jgi:CheY-like chemotaxis protein